VTVLESDGTVTISRCTNVEVFCGAVGTIVVEETTGCRLVLNERSLDADVTAVAVSDLVVVTVENNETTGETKIPCKIKHKVKGGKLVSSV